MQQKICIYQCTDNDFKYTEKIVNTSRPSHIQKGNPDYNIEQGKIDISRLILSYK